MSEYRRRKYLVAAFALYWLCAPALGRTCSTSVIARQTRWETPYYVIDANVPGPTVMIVGGVHGNEPAGSRAAEQIAGWRIERGVLIVLPRANVPGLLRNSRMMPGVADNRNLNRNFPIKVEDEPRCRLSKAIWDLVRTENPDWLLDLHEGADFTQINSKSVGSSIIIAKLPGVRARANEMLEALNRTIDDPNKEFVLKVSPVSGSLARSAADHLDVKSMILETTMKSQPISKRTRQHRIMVHRFLTAMEMVAGDMNMLIGDNAPEDAVRVALYDADGPILAAGQDANIGDFQCLAYFRTEIAENGAPAGVMQDTPAVIAGIFGRGRVLCCSPHPESTPGLEQFVRQAIIWSAGSSN